MPDPTSSAPSYRHVNATHTSWANTADPGARTRPAREAFLRQFEMAVDPDGSMDPAERERRVRHAMSAHFARLAQKPRQARRRRDELESAERVLVAELRTAADMIDATLGSVS